MVLSLGILAHNFLKVASDTHFSQLADYIRPIIVLMGLIFLYPFLKGIFKLKWSLSSFLIATRARTFFIFLPILLFLIYFIFDYTMVVTENPYFCGSCHTMETPFKTWQSGLLMVAKYFTGYYPPKSSANVSDASCLREGCHTKTKDDLYQPILCKQFENATIKFNHEVMLTQQNFGIELKCNNCHEHVSEES
ncbi:MAG: hypothetical protein JRJ00_16280, partial [Deltaproteobacteria bacterium]|nr:hypothetical protein [Deltaproteobacteria bacterium]